MQVMELTAQEIDHAIADINALVREAYRCSQGDFGWLDDANLDSWLQALEQDGAIEVPSFFTISGRVERVRRVFIESKPIGGAA
jgi:hypothetical protein